MPLIEKETYAFWTAARRLRLNVRNGRATATALDDISLIAKYTASPRLQARCAEILGVMPQAVSA